MFDKFLAGPRNRIPALSASTSVWTHPVPLGGRNKKEKWVSQRNIVRISGRKGIFWVGGDVGGGCYSLRVR